MKMSTPRDCDSITINDDATSIVLIFDNKRQVFRLFFRLFAKLWCNNLILKPFIRIRSNKIYEGGT